MNRETLKYVLRQAFESGPQIKTPIRFNFVVVSKPLSASLAHSLVTLLSSEIVDSIEGREGD